SLLQWIIRRDQKLMLTGYPSVAFNLRNDCRKFAKFRLTNHSTGEPRPDQALDHKRRAHGESSFRVLERHATADSRSGRRAIDFALREDTNVATVGIVTVNVAVDNRAV